MQGYLSFFPKKSNLLDMKSIASFSSLIIYINILILKDNWFGGYEMNALSLNSKLIGLKIFDKSYELV